MITSEQFRDLTDHLISRISSMSSCVNDKERMREWRHVKAAHDELVGFIWPKKIRQKDRDRANRAITRYCDYCGDHPELFG